MGRRGSRRGAGTEALRFVAGDPTWENWNVGRTAPGCRVVEPPGRGAHGLGARGVGKRGLMLYGIGQSGFFEEFQVRVGESTFLSCFPDPCVCFSWYQGKLG